ncbi:MAG: rhomboid family intramembrane serine protease [Erysipelotrichaceae bacterium]
MHFTLQDLQILQVVELLIRKYGYQIINVTPNTHTIYVTNPMRNDFPIVKVTKARIEDYRSDPEYREKIHLALKKITKSEGNLLVVSVNPLTLSSKGADYEVVNVAQEGFHHANEMVEALPFALVESQNIEQDIHTLDSKIVAQSKAIERKQARTWKNLPQVTVVVAALCVVYFAIINLVGLQSGDIYASSIFLGAYYKMSVFANHEFWRFLSAGFIHIDLLHLLVNMMALWSVGRICESLFTRKQYVAILLGSIVMGSAFVYIGDQNVISVGISGGLYGLLGAFVVYLGATGGFKNPAIRNSIIQIVLVNLLISFLPGVSLMGHLGGLVAGVLLGVLFTKKPSWAKLRMHTTIASCLLVGLLVGAIIQVDTITPYYGGTDQALVDTAREWNLNGYAEYMKTNFNEVYGSEVIK